MTRRTRQAKIVATLGPASSTAAEIRALVEAGVDVFRLNMSHGSHDDQKARVAAIRALEASIGRPLGILVDLQGPKIRVGKFAGGLVELIRGQPFRLDQDAAAGDATRAPLLHPEVFAALEPGALLLLDDGRVRLRVERCDARSAETTVVVGGALSDNKGVNLPGVRLPLGPLTDKDRRDLQFGLDNGADWIALSFVQHLDDVAEARRLIAGRAALMAKLEKPSAIEHLEDIVDMADAVMIARGDLGVEVPPEEVPGLQKRIVGVARQAGKPVVVATQMLESMVRSPAPTRAEASDVATAAYDGADALMLSAETASGDFPVEAVAIMDRIITTVERDERHRRMLDMAQADPERTGPDAITAAARQVAQTLHAAAIATYSVSGSTTLRAARERPEAPILGLTPSIAVARRLALAWGVNSVLTDDAHSFDDMIVRACQLAVAEGFATPGQRIVITAGMPVGTPGATNTLHVAWIEGLARRA
ncbi:MAG: pyruvate kinase [Alphaproteobacteria bacterium]|nr:pyruvate kinase [Alphaproteobacteria bacterium]